MRKYLSKLPIIVLPLLLTACVRDSATYYADSSNEHHLTVRREQEFFWADDARITLMASRLPECQRQIALPDMGLFDVEVELFAAGDNRWSLRAGGRVWQVETQSCALLAEGGAVAGERVGVFRTDGEKMVFEPEVAGAAAAPAAEAPAAEASAAQAPATQAGN